MCPNAPVLPPRNAPYTALVTFRLAAPWAARRRRTYGTGRHGNPAERALTWVLVGALPAGLALAACGTGPRHPAQAGQSAAPSLPPAASSPARPADLKRLVLGLGDLPPGFVARPLTSRNLPSDLTGCAGLQQLTGDSIGRHEQAEFFRPPIGPWIDEAVIAPASRPAARLTAALARAIARCSSVTVTEEGYRVTLALAPAPAPAPAAAAPAAG